MVLRAIVGYDGILSILGKSKHFALMYTYLLLLLLMLLLNFTFNLRKILGGGGGENGLGGDISCLQSLFLCAPDRSLDGSG